MDIASKLANLFNSFDALAVEKIAKACLREHRTLQQNITRFCCAWLIELSGVGYYDDRNECAVITAKKLCENEEIKKVLMNGASAPFI